jgi:hypothetical protein
MVTSKDDGIVDMVDDEDVIEMQDSKEKVPPPELVTEQSGTRR